MLAKHFLVLLTLAGATIPVFEAQAEDWSTYTNPRFGTTADYPAHLFTVRDPPPENGDGQSFRMSDGRARLTIYGAQNAEADTPQGYLQKYVDLEGVTYKRVTEHFYVVSGIRDEAIYYDRCNFSPGGAGSIDCLTITYPEAEKTAWDPIVVRMSESLRRAGPDEIGDDPGPDQELNVGEEGEQQTGEFAHPTIEGGRGVDFCFHWAKECGKPVADWFCQKEGFNTSTYFEVERGAPPTWVVGDALECDHPTCDRLRLIRCATSTP